MGKIKILFLLDRLHRGGAEKVMQTLVNHMDQSKFDITVHTLVPPSPGESLAPGIRMRVINTCKSGLGRRLFSLWIRLCAELRILYPLYIKDDYDVEVAYLEYGPTKLLAGSTNKHALKLAWVHCDLEKQTEECRTQRKLARQYSKYDTVVCVSQSIQSGFVRMFGSCPPSVVLHNVNDEEDIRQKAQMEKPERGKKPVFTTVGRLYSVKGNDRLIEVAKMLRDAGYDFEIRIVGEGPERSNLERMIQEYGLNDKVFLRGFCNNPYPHLEITDVVVCPSRSEGFSTVVTESLILGKPVVTTPCSGMRELLGDSEYGLITEDSVEGLYLGMKKLLDDPALRAHYARAAEKRGRQFEKKTILAQTEAFFCSELEKKRSKA